MQSLNLYFQGYFLEKEHAFLPDEAGVICAYACEQDLRTGEYIPTRLIYVTDCLSARSWVSQRDNTSQLGSFLVLDEKICYSFAPVPFARKQAAAALIYRHKPIANFEHKYSFPFQPTEVRLRGDTRKLHDSFVVPDPEDKAVSHLFDLLKIQQAG